MNSLLREESDVSLRVGEVYLDFEDVSGRWGKERLLNVRVGRIDIPFGEEYLFRDVIDNPLISHSLSDLWGVDEGIALYGFLGRVDYIVAVQNGGHPILEDFHADKSVAGRIGYEPNRWLRLSASAMRTGDLDVKSDKVSEMWFGNGFFRALGPAATKFHANLFEGDVVVRANRSHLRAAGGYVRQDDNDRSVNGRRNVYYYYVEGVQEVIEKLYGAARFSQIFTDGGIPIVGNSNFRERFFGPLTEEMWRLSVGAGYRWSPNLVLKVEYTIDRGEDVTGGKRDREDLFGVQAAFRF